jgi:uncharacterized membrane protein
VKAGFRLRGLEMTRLETFCDAAFAFAVTLLVISGDGIPRSYAELIAALKGIPAFAASFAAIASFWWAHREWSRRFGLEDGITTTLSLTMIAVMMVYVYPLKMIFSAFAFWVSGGFFPTEFTLDEPTQLLGIFAIYGFGFAAWATLLALLHARALRVGDRLGLNDVERLRTWQEITMNGTLAATGILSALFALIMPPAVGIWAGFAYMTLPITMPILAVRFQRAVEQLSGKEAA